MRKLYLIIPIILLMYLSCEDKREEDTTPPTVSIISPKDNDIVSESVTINCISTDNIGVNKVELWIDGVNTNIFDKSEPYSLKWNTTLIEDGNYTITVRSYDTNDNKTDSEPIVVVIDNSNSNPNPVQISSINLNNGEIIINWEQSIDGDFKQYDLEKSYDSNMDNYEIIFSTIDKNKTSHSENNVNPLDYKYYRISVIDTFNFETKSSIVSSPLDPLPTRSNIVSIEYNLYEMVLRWDECPDGDFDNYKILFSHSQNGMVDTITTIFDQNNTTYTLTEFDPTVENWFWIITSDTLGQNTQGYGYLVIDNPPSPSELQNVIFQDNSFFLSWSQNNDDDFNSYILYESLTEDMINKTMIFSTNNNEDTSYVINEIEEVIKYYQIVTLDIWGLYSFSNIQSGDSNDWFFLTYGGSETETGKSIIVTTNGDFVITGSTSSYGQGGNDIWLIKTDSNGGVIWEKTFGGIGNDQGESLIQTEDGGYIIIGSTSSYGQGGNDIWLIKTNSIGEEEWNTTFGGQGNDNGYSVIQDDEGNYVITGNKEVEVVDNQIYLIKTNFVGEVIWEKTFGGVGNDYGFSLIETSEGDYVITGKSSSINSGLLLKTDNQGNEIWSKSFGTSYDYGKSIIESTSNDGFILTGRSLNDFSVPVMVLHKVDYEGNFLHSNFFRTSGQESWGSSISSTSDGGYILTGGEMIGGWEDVFVVKTDSDGNHTWSKTYPGSFTDVGYDVKQTTNNKFIITGKTGSFGNGYDLLLIKTDYQGNTEDYQD